MNLLLKAAYKEFFPFIFDYTNCDVERAELKKIEELDLDLLVCYGITCVLFDADHNVLQQVAPKEDDEVESLEEILFSFKKYIPHVYYIAIYDYDEDKESDVITLFILTESDRDKIMSWLLARYEKELNKIKKEVSKLTED